jgi:hypothetical protein
MAELSTVDSFIVRIYRIDTEDRKRLTGQVEPLDGSRERTPFTDVEELAAVLSRRTGKRDRRRKREPEPLKLGTHIRIFMV